MQYKEINQTLMTDNILPGQQHQKSLWQEKFLALQWKTGYKRKHRTLDFCLNYENLTKEILKQIT